MKRLIPILLSLVLPLMAKAQSVTVLSMDMLQTRSYELKAHVVDSLTNESISFASAYLKHVSDTLITNFALSDTEGNIVLTEVTTGDYILTVEYLGYQRYQKNIYVRKDTDAGQIRLQPDVRALKAATITAAGTEVEFKQDTIIFNATMFKSGSNDNLAALLKRMPGIEISREGSVTVNGKAVDRITIEGKTFFLNDQSAALNNIPASIVDKIQVVDKDSDAAKISGIKDIRKERVMDVQLKEEYKQGFFGNLKVAGGGAVSGGNDNEFLVTDKVLFNSSLLASYYDEKDQVTLIGNAQNVADNGSMYVVVYGADPIESETLPSNGLHTSVNSGININTDRLKNISTTVFAKLGADKVDKHSFSDRTAFQMGAQDIRDKEDEILTGNSRSAAVNAELKNLNGKVYSFTFTPSLNYSSLTSDGRESSTSYLGDMLSHSSRSSTLKTDESVRASAQLNSSFKFKSNPRRRIGLNFTGTYGKGQGTEIIGRTIDYVSAERFTQSLDYDKQNSLRSVNVSTSYSEPVSDRWTLRLNLSGMHRYTTNDRAALENGLYSDLYSSYSTGRYTTGKVSLYGQYSKGTTTMNVGADFDAKQNWVSSTSNGQSTESGKGEWVANVSPYLNMSLMSKDMKTSYTIISSGSVQAPGASSMIPSLSIASPTRLSLGNAYLKPYLSQFVNVGINGSTAKKNTFNAVLTADLLINRISSAIWYDSSSIMYSVPVNVKDPGYSISASGSYGTLVTKDGKVRFNIGLSASVDAGTSYQSRGTRKGIDTDDFSYSTFMKEFWGSPEGERFYSGASGFEASRTTSYSLSVNPSLRLNLDNFQMRASLYPYFRSSRYSLDHKADMNTLDMDYILRMSYQAKHDIEFETDFEYDVLYGYKDMFSDPVFSWDASVLKNLKAFTIGLELRDILNSNRVQSRSITQNYSMFSVTNTLGRTVLLSVKFNFGKMNAAKSAAASSVSMKMAL